ncbi:MAG: type I-E CRISPR-associated protein Cse2/CasB [Armatimonadetes bacterium]|nr:type I-E CRISPR-associated protein Cse2/CasB [Armatimonadota bacterium]
MSTFKSPLVQTIQARIEKRDRQALADLRSGLGKDLGESPRMLPYLARFLSGKSPYEIRAIHLTASLMAFHAGHTEGNINLASGLRMIQDRRGTSAPDGPQRTSEEARLMAIMEADPEDLPHYLEAAVKLCESAGVDLNWHLFQSDAMALLDPNKRFREHVLRRWASAFWAPKSGDSEATEESTISQEDE